MEYTDTTVTEWATVSMPLWLWIQFTFCESGSHFVNLIHIFANLIHILELFTLCESDSHDVNPIHICVNPILKLWIIHRLRIWFSFCELFTIVHKMWIGFTFDENPKMRISVNNSHVFYVNKQLHSTVYMVYDSAYLFTTVTHFML